MGYSLQGTLLISSRILCVLPVGGAGEIEKFGILGRGKFNLGAFGNEQHIAGIAGCLPLFGVDGQAAADNILHLVIVQMPGEGG